MAQIRNFAFDITSATTTDFVDPQQKSDESCQNKVVGGISKLQFFFMILKF